MGYALLAFVWMLNFVISIWNAYAVGKVWVDAKHEGGWHRFMCWMGAIMSAAGFSWCYLIFLALTANYFQWITDQQTMISLNLGYILLIPFILFAGYAITLDSWATAYREGGFTNYGVAAYNTYASIHNTYSAIENFGGAFSSVADFFHSDSNDDDSKGNAIIIVIVLVAAALFGGILTTTLIIWRVAGTNALPSPPQEK